MGSPAFTRLGYLYRDERGLMHASEIYFRGAIRNDQRASVLAKLKQPHNRFIAHQVGLPDLQHLFWEARGRTGPDQHDQVWNELSSLLPVERCLYPPEQSIDELLAAFARLTRWDEAAAAVRLINGG